MFCCCIEHRANLKDHANKQVNRSIITGNILTYYAVCWGIFKNFSEIPVFGIYPANSNIGTEKDSRMPTNRSFHLQPNISFHIRLTAGRTNRTARHMDVGGGNFRAVQKSIHFRNRLPMMRSRPARSQSQHAQGTRRGTPWMACQ